MPLLILLLTVAAYAQLTLQDKRDGKTYKIVKIGEQTWMAENLNYDAEGSKCYENKPENCEKYGRLYNWETAMTFCPSGWHLPSNDEWNALMKAAGGELTAGKKLKAKSGWADYKDNTGNGTDDYGFSALPGGHGGHGNFGDAGNTSLWWSSSEYDSVSAYGRLIHSGDDGNYWYAAITSYLRSVRCVRDKSSNSGGIGDYLIYDYLRKSKGSDINDTSRSKQEIMAVVNARMPDLRKIYNKHLKAKPGLSGKITLKFTIAPSGNVIVINIVSSTTGDPEFDEAIKNAVIMWKWRTIRKGNTTPTIPFSFTE